ncbi:hypothetical protein D3C72_1319870 [compost metagenome]
MSKHEAVEVFTEIFHHVVTLGFAVHQHVQPQAFLFNDRLFDVFANAGAVVIAVQTPLLEVQAQAANFRGLRERPYRGGRPGRQVKARTLCLSTLGIRTLTFAVLRGNRRQALAYLRIMHAAGLATSADWCAIGVQFGLLFCTRCVQRRAQQGQFGAFLQSKGEPAFHLFVQASFHAQIDRAVQQ